jgi:2-phospho-L-lactate guanylyltransferase
MNGWPNVYAIIPVKPLQDGKSRLRDILSDHDRELQNRHFLQRTLSLAEDFPGPSLTIVVSRSEEVCEIARSRGMIALAESPDSDLNAALALATDFALTRNADGMIYLPVDLPLAAPETLRQVVSHRRHPSLVLVPDRHLQGTNVLFQAPIKLRRFAFGRNSLRCHIGMAHVAGLKPRVTRIGSLAFDIDSPLDISDFEQLGELRPLTVFGAL